MLKLTMNSDFYCVNCLTKGIPIPRRSGSERKAGHLKRLYCLNCKKEFNHVECKAGTRYDFDDLIFEKENGNFDEEGNRLMPYGLFKEKIRKEKRRDKDE